MRFFKIFLMWKLSLCVAIAEDVAFEVSEPSGYTSVTCLTGSDTIVSIPFIDETNSLSSKVSGVVSLTGTSPSNTASFDLDGVTGLVSNFYKDKYYLRFTSGLLEGSFYQVDSNAADNVTLKLEGDNGALIAANDEFVIYKFWTLDTLFPPATQTTVVGSTDPFQTLNYTLVYRHDEDLDGLSAAPTVAHYILNNDWYRVGGGLSGAEVIWPDQYLIIRHNAAVATPTIYRPKGKVDVHHQFSVPLRTLTTGPQDNHVAIPRPLDLKLKDLGLIESGAFVSSANNFPFNRRDQLFVFDNTTSHINKSGSRIYFYNGSNWIKNGSGFPNADDDIIKATEGIVIRKYKTTDGASSIWHNYPSYVPIAP